MFSKYRFLLSLLALFINVFSGSCQEMESLKSALKAAVYDSARCRILNEMIEREADDNIWPAYNEQMKILAEDNLRKSKPTDPQTPVFKKYLGAALNNIAVTIQNKGNSALALQFYLKSLRLREEVRDSFGVGETLNNIGLIYHAQGNIPLAIEYYRQSLKLQELIGDYSGISTALLNLGVISSEQDDLEKAEDYFRRSYSILAQTDDDYGKAYSLNNLAGIYKKQGNFPKAYSTYLQSLSIREKIEDMKGIAYSLFNIGILIHLMDSADAKKRVPDQLLKSLSIFEKLGDKEGIATVINKLSELYYTNREYERALVTAKRSLQLSRELGYPEHIRNASGVLYRIYKTMKRDAEALAMYELYTEMRDSISNQELRRFSLEQQYRYEFDKRITADSVKAAEQQKVMSARVSKERTQRYAVTGVLMLTILFSGFILNRWRIIKRQKLQIQEQHTALGDEKKKTDDLLLNILPKETAEELKRTGHAKALHHEEVSVLFTDFENFTQASEKMDAEALVEEIHFCYSAFDSIIGKYAIEKIKTIGDGYLCASGLPIANTNHAIDLVNAALEMQTFMQEYRQRRMEQGRACFVARMGIHSGPVISGVVGTRKFAYDIWGDTVNVAARMESAGVAGKVNVSEKTMELVKEYFELEYRGPIEVKNKGEMNMYFVRAKNSPVE